VNHFVEYQYAPLNADSPRDQDWVFFNRRSSVFLSVHPGPLSSVNGAVPGPSAHRSPSLFQPLEQVRQIAAVERFAQKAGAAALSRAPALRFHVV